MNRRNYYPLTLSKRALWWENVLRHSASLADVGFSATEMASVVADARWAVFCYRKVRETFEELGKVVTSYCNEITGERRAQMPLAPPVPAFPAPPDEEILPGIEWRRTRWVQRAKASPRYESSTGVLLGIETPAPNFDPATYQAVLLGLSSPASRTLRAKFRKASGVIDGINLYGSPVGAEKLQALGRFTVSPLTILVPLTTETNESWRFQARAVRRDREIGEPSAIVEQIIRA